MLQTAIALSFLLPCTDAAPVDEVATEQPLAPVLKMAYEGYEKIEREIRDYQCILTKRERVNGRLRGHETMFVKIRHRQVEDGQVTVPFAVYVKFYAPEKVKGREVIFVEGKNDDKMIVRNGGERFGFITTSVPPNSEVAMQESRYPITEIGMKNLVRRLIEVGNRLKDRNDYEVKTLEGAKINGRPCTLIQVSHPEQAEGQTFKMARIFVDEELHLPVHYTAYGWPDKDGDAPELLEQYTYTDIRLNVGFSDWDFDHRNEQYEFLKGFKPAK